MHLTCIAPGLGAAGGAACSTGSLWDRSQHDPDRTVIRRAPARLIHPLDPCRCSWFRRRAARPTFRFSIWMCSNPLEAAEGAASSGAGETLSHHRKFLPVGTGVRQTRFRLGISMRLSRHWPMHAGALGVLGVGTTRGARTRASQVGRFRACQLPGCASAYLGGPRPRSVGCADTEHTKRAGVHGPVAGQSR